MVSIRAALDPERIPGRRRFRAAAVLTTAASFFASSGLLMAADAPLTLAEAQRRAVDRSQQIAAQDASAAASREMAVAAGQLPDPMLKIGVDNLPIDGPDRFSLTRDFMTMRRIGLMQELTRGEKRRLRAARFELEAEKSLVEKNAAIAAIQRDTALAWLDRYYAEAMAVVIAEQIEESRLEIEAAESAYRAGRGHQADIFAARSARVALEDRASEYRRRIDAAKAVLARWAGDAAGLPLGGEPSVDSIRLDIRSLDWELAHHPQIVVLAKQEEIAANEVGQAQANRKADWSVEVMYNQRGSAFSNMISVGVSVPLQWDRGNRQDRELAAKLAMAEQARAQREDALRAHIAEVRSMVIEWENGRERRTRYETQLIPLARERTRAALDAYRGGKSSLTDALAARRGEVEVRMQVLQLAMETARLWAQLNFLFPIGVETPRASFPPIANSMKESK